MAACSRSEELVVVDFLVSVEVLEGAREQRSRAKQRSEGKEGKRTSTERGSAEDGKGMVSKSVEGETRDVAGWGVR